MITVRLATTPAEIEAALRLRYEVFYEEEGDARYADHERRLWTDRDDGPQSHLLIAVDEEQRVVGTVRVTVFRDCKFIAHEAYQWNVLAEVLQLEPETLSLRVARMDRGAVQKDCRGTGVLVPLQSLAEDTALRHHCDIMVGAPFVDNLRARRAYAKLGWNDYPISSTYGGLTAQLIFKQLKVL